MFKRIMNFLVNDNELESEWQKLLSLIFLFTAGLMSFFSYTDIGFLWDTQLKFTPRFVSTIIGIVLVAPLYLRNILKWNKSIYAIISFVLILLVFASFIELATGGNHKNNLVYSLIAISIILSWLGIRGIAGISWILVLASAVYIVIINNLALGFNGFIYISLGFLGLLMHSGLNPGMLFKNIKEEYSSTAIHAKNVVKSEIEKTGEMTSKAI